MLMTVSSGGWKYPRWRKSSHSGSGQGSDCVEVAIGPDAVGLRDSKDRIGPLLVFSVPHWRRFIATLR